MRKRHIREIYNIPITHNIHATCMCENGKTIIVCGYDSQMRNMMTCYVMVNDKYEIQYTRAIKCDKYSSMEISLSHDGKCAVIGTETSNGYIGMCSIFS